MKRVFRDWTIRIIKFAAFLLTECYWLAMAGGWRWHVLPATENEGIKWMDRETWEQGATARHTRTGARFGVRRSVDRRVPRGGGGGGGGWDGGAMEQRFTGPFPTHLTVGRGLGRAPLGVSDWRCGGWSGGWWGGRRCAGGLVVFKGERRSSVCQSSVGHCRPTLALPPSCSALRRLVAAGRKFLTYFLTQSTAVISSMQMWRTKRALSESDCEDSSIYDSKE